MSDRPILPSPFQRAWNVFSAVAGVIGTAGMIDDMANWAELIQTIIRGYDEIIRPILGPIVNAFNFPDWFTDYLFVGLMLASARVRPIFNHMQGHWQIDVSGYRWWAIWAPHRIATYFASVLMALLWPLALLLFLPPRVLKIEEGNTFQLLVWRDQFQWLAIYALTLIGLLIVNAGLMALAGASAK